MGGGHRWDQGQGAGPIMGGAWMGSGGGALHGAGIRAWAGTKGRYEGGDMGVEIGTRGVARRAPGRAVPAPSGTAVPGARDRLFPAALEQHSRSFFPPKKSSDPALPSECGTNPLLGSLPAAVPRDFV